MTCDCLLIVYWYSRSAEGFFSQLDTRSEDAGLHYDTGVRGGGECYAVLVGGGSNGDGAWRDLVTVVELIDPRPHILSLPCTQTDLHFNLYERPSIDSRNSESPFDPPTRSAY